MNMLTARALLLNEMDEHQVSKLHLLEGSALFRILLPFQIVERFNLGKAIKSYKSSWPRIEKQILLVHSKIEEERSDEIDEIVLMHAADLRIRSSGIDISCDPEKKIARAKDEDDE